MNALVVQNCTLSWKCLTVMSCGFCGNPEGVRVLCLACAVCWHLAIALSSTMVSVCHVSGDWVGCFMAIAKWELGSSNGKFGDSD